MSIHTCLSVCAPMSIFCLVYASNMHTLTPSGIHTHTGHAVLVKWVWTMYATAHDRDVLRRRLENVKTCTHSTHRWAVGGGRGGSHGQGSLACDNLGRWRVAATSRHVGSGNCDVGASAGTGSRLLRGWCWKEGDGVGVGPLILVPFLLEHSF